MAEVLPVGTALTSKGQRLIAKLLAAEGALEFTRAAVGSGILQNGVSPESMIGLIDYKMDAEISAYGVENDQAYVTAQVSSDNVKEGFLVTEVGVFAKDPDEGEILYAYMDISGDPTYIYAEGTGNIVKFAEFQLYVLIGQLKSVTAVITPGSFVSREDFKKAIAGLGKVIIGSSGTQLRNNDTLFVIDGDVPVTQSFGGASFANATFSESPPASGQNWMQPEIIDGNLTVSESASADKDAVFFAHITQ